MNDNNQDLNNIILAKLHELIEKHTELKSSVEAHLDKIDGIHKKTEEHQDILRKHTTFFHIIFWISTTVGGLTAAAIFRLPT